MSFVEESGMLESARHLKKRRYRNVFC